MTAGFVATDRSVLRVSGPDARDFLQGLVTNDVRRLDQGPVYAALLSPQGKYLFDFFLVPAGADVLIDVKAGRAAALLRRLGLYRLRAQVEIAPADLAVAVGLGDPPAAGFRDPRDPELGWRRVDTIDSVLCPEGPWAQLHTDVFAVPPTARVLGTSWYGPQCFVDHSLGARSIAWQFHPEVTTETYSRWIDEDDDMIRAAGAEPAAVLIALDRMERSGKDGALSSGSAVQQVAQEFGIPVISIANLDDLFTYLSGEDAGAERAGVP